MTHMETVFEGRAAGKGVPCAILGCRGSSLARSLDCKEAIEKEVDDIHFDS